METDRGQITMSRKPTKYHARMHTNGIIELNTTGISVEAYVTNGSGDERKLGTLTVSAGSVRWVPAGERNPYRLNWPMLKDLLEAFGQRK